MTSAPITPPAGTDRLPEGFSLHHLESVGSTNDEAARLAAAGAADGTIVLADRQTRGRGRLGRPWRSDPGNLYASVLLRPDCRLTRASELSLLAGVALADMLEAERGDALDLKLKWPNDVLIGGAKVAGILLESAGDREGRVDHVIIGLGVNVAWSPDDLAYPATSLDAEGFAPRPPEAWLGAYAASLAIWLDRWRRDGFAVVRNAWRARSYGLGRSIRLRLDREDVDGRFVDLTEGGALLIERADGTRRELTAGDVVYADH